MVRPSHYLFAFTALFIAVGGWLNSRESGPVSPGDGRTSPSVVASHITGTVLDRLGWPVPGAKIGEGDFETRTDSKGRFRITPPGPTAFDLRISAPEHSVRWERVHPASGEPLFVILGDHLPWRPAEARPEPGPAATSWAGEGWVTDEDGQLVVGAEVTVVETGATVRTDDVGRYIIPLPRTEVSLIARHENLVARAGPLSLPRDRQEGLTPLPKLSMKSGATLRAVLRGPGAVPLTGGAVILEDGRGLVRRAEAGTGGKVEISGLLEGEYQLTALPFRGSMGFRLPVLVHGDLELGELELLPEEELRVQVVDRRGNPQALAHVVVEEAGLRIAHSRADDDGWVTLSGLAGGNRQFTVRSSTDFRVLPVLGLDGDQLIVAVD